MYDMRRLANYLCLSSRTLALVAAAVTMNLVVSPLAAVRGDSEGTQYHPTQTEISYYNCDVPAAIHRYDLRSLCDHNKPQLGPISVTPYQLVQRVESRVYKGYSCLLERSTFYASCGVNYWVYIYIYI